LKLSACGSVSVTAVIVWCSLVTVAMTFHSNSRAEGTLIFSVIRETNG